MQQRITFKLIGDDHLQINVFTVWRRFTYLTCVSPFRPSSAGGSCGRQSAGHSSCRVQGLRSVRETLLCRARRFQIILVSAGRNPEQCVVVMCIIIADVISETYQDMATKNGKFVNLSDPAQVELRRYRPQTKSATDHIGHSLYHIGHKQSRYRPQTTSTIDNRPTAYECLVE